MIEAYFSEIRNIILKELQKATAEINIAVCWFVNQELFDALCNKLENNKNISINLIILNDLINNREGGLDFQRFINLNGNFYYSNLDKSMHNKYCIIDNRTVISGSYNWTNKAENNEENISLITELNTVASFQNDFKRLISITPLVKNIESEANRAPQNVIVEDSDVTPVDELSIQKVVENKSNGACLSSFGLICDKDEFVILIPKETQLPFQETLSLFNSADQQISCCLDIRYGEHEIGSSNSHLGFLNVIDMPPMRPGQAELITTFSINKEILTVLVIVKRTLKTTVQSFDIKHLLITH